jgi:SAM-dependent methyltransferase
MPDLEANIDTWNAGSSWSAHGEEWSGAWGSSEAQWWGTLMPRLHAFIPTGTILELGPGHGRWTQYLKDLCDDMILVDVAESCIDACRARFASADNLSFHVNDGKSLDGVPSQSVDLAFSFDSLVHAEADVLDAYAGELARTLKPDGIAFIHHSNIGAYPRLSALTKQVPPRIRPSLIRAGWLINTYAWRAETVTAELFSQYCEKAGLACIGQEKIVWEYGRQLTDVISLCTPAGSKWARPNVVVENPGFMDEATRVREAASIYSSQSFIRAEQTLLTEAPS